MSLTITPLSGEALVEALDDVARLRIEVFREWPYLYDGDISYERKYLQTYRKSDKAILVGAFDQGRLVGASTGTPMQDHPEFAKPFAQTDLDLTQIFYCAESVLLPEYRGQGAGHAFFDHREAHAKVLGARCSAFCAVIRPDDHPARPKEYRSLDPFWRARGYQPLEGVIAEFKWKDIGQCDESKHSLQFWLKEL